MCGLIKGEGDAMIKSESNWLWLQLCLYNDGIGVEIYKFMPTATDRDFRDIQKSLIGREGMKFGIQIGQPISN